MNVANHILTVAQLADYLGVTRATVFRMVEDGRFPQPKKLGRRSVWSRATVEAWVVQNLEVPAAELAEARKEAENGDL